MTLPHRSPLRLEAFTRQDRFLATEQAKEALSSAGAWISRAELFSNKMTSLFFEDLPTAKLPLLLARLEEEQMHLHHPPDPQKWPEEELLQGSLAIHFIHGEPDLKRIVPAVPG